MSNGVGVSVGNIKKMGGEQPQPPAEELSGFERWRQSEYGLPGVIKDVTGGVNRFLSDVGSGIGGFFSGAAPAPTPPATKGVAGSGRVTEQILQAPIPETSTLSFEDYLASRGFGTGAGGGGGAIGPDYSAYRAALTDQAAQLNARIQAMYNQLAEQAGANVARVQDIYGGATQGIGSVYDESAGNVQQAFESAQQQAADQLARLGIEAAAEQVLPTQALAQAQALAGLEAGRASGLSAAERYGASGAQFGSEMAQTAQQQGTEMNAAILASLQNRLNESLAAEMAGRGGGGGGRGMSVSDQLRLQEAYRRDVLGELPLEERQFAFDVAQASARPANEFSQWQRDTFLDLTLPRDGQKPLMTPEEATAYLNAVESSLGR